MTDEHRKRLSTEAEPSAPVREAIAAIISPTAFYRKRSARLQGDVNPADRQHNRDRAFTKADAIMDALTCPAWRHPSTAPFGEPVWVWRTAEGAPFCYGDLCLAERNNDEVPACWFTWDGEPIDAPAAWAPAIVPDRPTLDEVRALGNTPAPSIAASRAAPGETVEGDVRPPETPVVGDVLNPDLGEER